MVGSGQKFLFLVFIRGKQNLIILLRDRQAWTMTLQVTFGYQAAPLAILMLDTKESVEILFTRNPIKHLCKVQARIPAGICSKNIRNGKHDAQCPITRKCNIGGVGSVGRVGRMYF